MNTTTLIIMQAVVAFTLGLIVRDLTNRNKDLQDEVNDLRSKLISETENHTKQINQACDLASELAQLKCELAKLRHTK